MGFDKGPCGPQYEDYEAAWNAWKNKSDAADRAIRRAAAATAVATGLCGAAWWTGAGTVGCVGAAATALYFDGESISASNERNEAAEKANAELQKYKDCVEIHKNYYGG